MPTLPDADTSPMPYLSAVGARFVEVGAAPTAP